MAKTRKHKEPIDIKLSRLSGMWEVLPFIDLYGIDKKGNIKPLQVVKLMPYGKRLRIIVEV